MCDVFISYKSDEYAEASWLRQVLEKNSISCWIAPESIPGGSNYGREIPMAIRNCRVFVLVLSNKAQKSIWISKEINMALNTGKIIMPFTIENCELHKEFNFYLSDVQRYDAYKSKSDAIKQMVSEIKKILGHTDGDIYLPDGKEAFKASEPVEIFSPSMPNEPVVKNNNKSDKLKLILLLLFTYLIFIPGGVITNISYFIEGYFGKHNKKFIITKILCMLAILTGLVFFMFATFSYSHCNEAYYLSVIGIIIEISFNL